MGKELKAALDRKNAARAFFSSLLFSIAVPAYLLFIHLSGIFQDHTTSMKIYLSVMEATQLIGGLSGYFLLSTDETDKLQWYARGYFYITAVFALFLARNELAHLDSYLFYVAAAAFAALTPVWTPAERRCFTIPLFAGFCITAVTTGTGMFKIAAVAAIGIGMILLSVYIQNTLIEQERMLLKLRAKTISSERDPLTGLTNRRGLDRKVSVLWPYCARTAAPIGLIEIDIDYFKKYNDKFGHPAGDRCLKKVAQAIRSSAKRASDISARTGGEEFMVFVQGSDESDVIKLALEIRKNIASLKIPHAYVNVSNYVTVSMGIAVTVPTLSTSFDEVYEAADQALYLAKENGRNCIVCEDRIYGKMRNDLALRISDNIAN